MTTLAASAHRRGVAVLEDPIANKALASRRSSSRRRVPAKYSAIRATIFDHNPWLPIKPTAAVRIACDDEDPDVFYGPVDSAGSEKLLAWERKALAICAECRFQQKCLTDALQHPAAQQHGVVGGMTAGQRRALLRDVHQKSGQVA
jgi:Transcription factor WhiB